MYSEETKAMFTRDYLPLSLGTVQLGSQECYSCGKVTLLPHGSMDCYTPTHILRNKGSWRSDIDKILYPVGQCTNISCHAYNQTGVSVAQINVTRPETVEYNPYLYSINTLTFLDNASQRNRLESC